MKGTAAINRARLKAKKKVATTAENEATTSPADGGGVAGRFDNQNANEKSRYNGFWEYIRDAVHLHKDGPAPVTKNIFRANLELQAEVLKTHTDVFIQKRFTPSLN